MKIFNSKVMALLLAGLLVSACRPAPTPAATASNLPPAPTQRPSLSPSLTPTPGKPTRTPRPTPTLPAIPESACIPTDGQRTSGIVARATDGDTIDVSIQGLVFTVRYLGIDTPETVNPIERLGKEASARNRDLVSGKRVTLVSDPQDEDRDRYGRLLRFVLVDDIFVNYQLVREGLAHLFISGNSCGPVLLSAYQAAQADKIGLFAPTAIP
ncbi:MAG: thermonuclease family protein [Anaerolineae bacterium]|nr:thermonuclease family protein [Anaerolineae bacterium]